MPATFEAVDLDDHRIAWLRTKRPLVVETLGLVLAVVVHGADWHRCNCGTESSPGVCDPSRTELASMDPARETENDNLH
jgi:hypothetical protein